MRANPIPRIQMSICPFGLGNFRKGPTAHHKIIKLCPRLTDRIAALVSNLIMASMGRSVLFTALLYSLRWAF
jgi:hypothetical protein